MFIDAYGESLRLFPTLTLTLYLRLSAASTQVRSKMQPLKIFDYFHCLYNFIVFIKKYCHCHCNYHYAIIYLQYAIKLTLKSLFRAKQLLNMFGGYSHSSTNCMDLKDTYISFRKKYFLITFISLVQEVAYHVHSRVNYRNTLCVRHFSFTI